MNTLTHNLKTYIHASEQKQIKKREKIQSIACEIVIMY